MKTNSIYLIGFFLFLIMAGCHYDEIPIDPVDPCINGAPPCCTNPGLEAPDCCPNETYPPCDPCEDSTNPTCCGEPNCCNDNCTTMFSLPIDVSTTMEFNCNSPQVDEVVELPNGEGYLIAGTCYDNGSSSRRGMLVHVNLDGTINCNPKDFLNKDGANLFYSINLDKNNTPILTGFTRGADGINASVFNFVAGDGCTEFSSANLDGGEPGTVTELWDNGKSIIPRIESNDNSLMIGGKWEGVPALIQVQNTSLIGDTLRTYSYGKNEFSAFNIDLDLTSNNHDIEKLIQTNDLGFLMTGFVDVVENGVRVRKGFYLKTPTGGMDLSPAIIKVFSQTEVPDLRKNALGLDLIQLNNGNYFVMVGYSYTGTWDNDVVSNREGFVLVVNALTGDFVGSLPLNNVEEDAIQGIVAVDPSSLSFLVTGVETDNTSRSLMIREYTVSGMGTSISVGSITPPLVSQTGRNMVGTDIIKTSDGGYFIIGEVRNGNTREGIHIIKTDANGNF